MNRRNIIYVSIASLALLFAACNKQEAPEGVLKIYTPLDYALDNDNPVAETDTLYTGVNMTFVVKNATGDTYSLWLGEDSSDYNNRRVSETMEGDTNFVRHNPRGLVMKQANNDFVVETAYTQPGEFVTTLVGRNIYEKGAEYKEMTVTRRVVVADTACFLFHPDASRGDYVFAFTKPRVMFTTFEELAGFKIQPYFEANVMSQATAVSMNLQAGAATIEATGGNLEFFPKTGIYQWTGVDMTQEQTITLTSRSGYSRTYTILPAQVWVH
jgi:hypothetical protein